MRFSPTTFICLIALTATIGTAQPVSIEAYLSAENVKWPAALCDTKNDPLSHRVFSEYGAIYVADSRTVLPKQCVFQNDSEVKEFQKTARTIVSYINGYEIELQESAMKELLSAIAEAESRNKKITPLDGSIAGKRSFNDTGSLWNSRFHRALQYWVDQGRIDPAMSDSFRWQPFRKQAEQVMKWEAENLYFSTDFSRSIFSSTAPPGTSQHLTMLAFDVVQYGDPEIRKILNDHGWYQTIIGDPPHFTFLGLKESELPRRGLKFVYQGSHQYWVPNLSTTPQTIQASDK